MVVDDVLEKKLLLLCRVLVCLTFLGRAWQHLRWDAPVRALLWKQAWLEPLITGVFGVSWRDWVTNLAVDEAIQGGVRVMGVFYLLCAVTACIATVEKRWTLNVMKAGSAMLLLLSGLYFIENYFRIGQLIEYSLQWSVPLFLVAILRGGLRRPRFILLVKVAVGLTFIGHGMYAAGLYPTPGHFVTMLMNGLGLSEDSARVVLATAGYLDFVLVVFLFVPKLEKPALAYAVIWGTATAFARMVANFNGADILGWLDAWTWQTLYRLVHGGMPLLIWFLIGKQDSAVAATESRRLIPA